jgi:hypothetical protein
LLRTAPEEFFGEYGFQEYTEPCSDLKVGDLAPMVLVSNDVEFEDVAGYFERRPFGTLHKAGR